MPLFRLVVLSTLLLCVSCAAPTSTPDDPYEAINRKVHGFNKGLDAAIFARSDENAPEKRVLHPDISESVINFADNAGGPGMVLNGLLQADIASATTNGFRFVLNSTVGVFGIFDPADAIGLPEMETDFAQTLAVWDVSEGNYLELPLLGPATERDLLGRIVDAVIDPLDRFGAPVQRDYGTIARLAGRAFKRNQFGDTIDSVLHDSADSYAQTRLIYLQNRRFELGVDAQQDVDPYDDIFGDQ